MPYVILLMICLIVLLTVLMSVEGYYSVDDLLVLILGSIVGVVILMALAMVVALIGLVIR